MWPTPVATDAAGARRSTARTPAWTSKPGTTLLDAVIETGALWPTLRAHDGDGPGGRDSATEGGPSLPAAVQLWPTPTASEYGTSQGGINKTRPSGHTPSLFTMARRQGAPLNPAWVETLTGLPIGWSCPADGLRREDGRKHDWEPPRALEGVPDRRPRLRALGNAVVPHVARLAGELVRALDEAPR